MIHPGARCYLTCHANARSVIFNMWHTRPKVGEAACWGMCAKVEVYENEQKLIRRPVMHSNAVEFVSLAFCIS